MVFLTLALGAQALTPSHYLSRSDVERLQALMRQPFTDLESAYYSIVGLGKLGSSIADEGVSIKKVNVLMQLQLQLVFLDTFCLVGNTIITRISTLFFVDSCKCIYIFLQDACQFLKSKLDPTSVDSLFFAAESSQAISGCEVAAD